jgi:thiol-disulfide isomerase/thioredoxin
MSSISTISAQEIQVKISGNIFNANADSIFIAQFFGNNYKDFVGTKMKKNGDFSFDTTLPYADYYALRFNDSRVNLILRDGAEIKVYGDGAKIDQFANIVGSEESSRMNELLRINTDWRLLVDSVNAVVQADPSKKNEVNNSMRAPFQEYQGKVRKFMQENQNSAALMAMLGAVNPQQDFESYETIVKQLMAGFSVSPSVQQLYKDMEVMKAEMIANDPLGAGKLAPDFEETMPSGETMALSDLRGKVVLLDFWASWCGPCRRENPNVVGLYKKYKDQGFTVMSVSLDKDRSKWLAAIEKDQLIWPNHVSDLNYWQSKAAQQYGVSSIPFTVLIDREGKIIKTNLRGPLLEQELSRIFGDS